MCLKNPYDKNNWDCNIQKKLFHLELNDLWYSQHSVYKEHIMVIKQRLCDFVKQEFDATLDSSTKCFLHK